MPETGQVKWFDPKKGYGFIIGPEGQDVFVHFSQITGDGFRLLKHGEEVEYELIESDKGFRAESVVRLNPDDEIQDDYEMPERRRDAG